ncbi:DUF6308 family protein [Corynebacterium pilosum]|uniref:DUF6308 family protein n=1 Tax=Corynebacterium pilosum TaxID=35756 RepID=UPI003312FE20
MASSICGAYYWRRLALSREGQFTGEYFGRWDQDPSPNAFIAEDIVAVSCLSVNIPAPPEHFAMRLATCWL